MRKHMATTATATEAARANLATFLTCMPVVEAPAQPWHPSMLTVQQQRDRIAQEAAMRQGQLRRLPTCFGGLDDLPEANRKSA